MRLVRYLKNYVRGNEHDIRERSFVNICLLVEFFVLVIYIWNFFIGEHRTKIIALSMIVFVVPVILFLSLKFDKTELGAVLLCMSGSLIVFPAVFFTAGGMRGCAILWDIFFFVFISVSVRGLFKIFLLILHAASILVCYIVSYIYPATVLQRSYETEILDSAGSVIAVGFLLVTIMEYQRFFYIEENKRTREQSKRVEDLNASQNRFFSSMSHEIRTPINTIIGFNEMILREEISEEVAEDAINVQSASKMLLSLINDILDMSKIESGQMELVKGTYAPGDMLSDIVGMLWIKAREKNLDFHIEVDPSLPVRMVGDEMRIKQVILNVLNNSIKYTSEGSISLSVGFEKKNDREGTVVFTIADTGMGIKKENIPYLFSAFKRVDEEKNRYIEGTGLGLNIVKELVDLMGGKISVNSIYTKGSTFIIYIPQEISSEESVGKLNLEERHTLGKRKNRKVSFEAPKANILVVDDNHANVMVVQKLLRDTKIHIDAAESGQEALKKTQYNKYDLIFMDHLMPEMDGIECLHAIRNQTGGFNTQTQVVVLTANSGEKNRVLYSREGFDGYLLKPVSSIELEEELVNRLPKDYVVIKEEDVFEAGDEYRTKIFKRKMPVIITTESVSDLPVKFYEDKGVDVIPYYVHTENGDFLDGLETGVRGLVFYIKDEKKNAYSEAPKVSEYEEFFARNLLKAVNIIHISMSSSVGLGYKRALEASESFENVTVIDSKHLSSGMGLLVLEAARLVNETDNPDVIINRIIRSENKVHTSFVVDDTEYLKRAGRLAPVVYHIATSLFIHPVLTLRKGKMLPSGFYFGTKEHARKKYINRVLSNKNIDTSLLFVTYVDLEIEEQKEIEELINKKKHFDRIIFQCASSAISVNCGPGSFGLLYREKDNTEQ